MAFPPKGGFGGPPPLPRPPRNLRDVRRSVGTASLQPDDAAGKDSVTVSITCPACGNPINKTFGSDTDDNSGAGPVVPPPPPPPPPGGPMGGGGL
jgi:hypothetical protein